MNAIDVYNRAESNGISFYLNCSSPRIKNIMDNTVKGNADIIKSLILKHCPDMYYDLGLNFYNPYHNYAYRSKDGKYLIYTVSAIEYVFKIK